MTTANVEQTPNGLVVVNEDGVRQPAYLMKTALDKVGMSESTYYRWVRAKKIPDVKLRTGGKWRVFTDEDIERLRRAVESD
jgi:predicted DNA-binding transcriptional regulator AlpA